MPVFRVVVEGVSYDRALPTLIRRRGRLIRIT
jgi:hypothetical protein